MRHKISDDVNVNVSVDINTDHINTDQLVILAHQVSDCVISVIGFTTIALIAKSWLSK